MTVFIGTSGYSYFHWIGRFYPKELPQSQWLKFYTKNFNTVELNNTFYRLPQEKAFKTWYEIVPSGFIFSVKVNRYITGVKRLLNIEEPLKLFLKRVSNLKEKVGVLLFQFPPNFKLNLERLKKLLKLLPKDFKCSFEFRHTSWYTQEVYDLFNKYNISFCIADWPIKIIPPITSDFIYIRRHGATAETGPYGGDYPLKELKNLSQKIKNWNKETYVYFNNDANAYAVKNAIQLCKML